MEKESMEDSWENLTEEHSFAAISQLLDQALILLRQSAKTCTYVHRFNRLMTFANDKKNIKTRIRENSEALIDESNSNMLFDPTFEETVAKSLSWKSKLKKLLEVLSQQYQRRKQSGWIRNFRKC